MVQASEKAKVQRKLRQDEVAVEAKERLNICHEATEHEYLTSKKVKSYGLKQLNGNLIVPVYSTSGELRSLQSIDKKGNKRFKFYTLQTTEPHYLWYTYILTKINNRK